jgi:hypothetical protein
MSELKHTQFMRGLRNLVPEYLPDGYQKCKFGRTDWFFQLYYGNEARIHYEVSRTWSRKSRQLEIGLHFESRDKDLNRHLLEQFQRYLFELREELGEKIVAEQWDRGWTKVYEAYPSEALTRQAQQFAAERLATFIATVQPLYEHLRARR